MTSTLSRWSQNMEQSACRPTTPLSVTAYIGHKLKHYLFVNEPWAHLRFLKFALYKFSHYYYYYYLWLGHDRLYRLELVFLRMSIQSLSALGYHVSTAVLLSLLTLFVFRLMMTSNTYGRCIRVVQNAHLYVIDCINGCCEFVITSRNCLHRGLYGDLL